MAIEFKSLKVGNKILNVGNRTLSFKNASLIYDTDFTNLDFNTGIDIPLKGNPLQWSKSGTIQKTTRTINGVVYPVLYISGGSGISLVENIFELYPDLFSIEATLYKDSYDGCWCALYAPMASPNFNCWTGDRGIGVSNSRKYNDTTYYNGFYNKHDDCCYSDYYNRTNVSQIITGGITHEVNNKTAKLYLAGKKAIKIVNWDYASSHGVSLWCDNSWGSATMCVLNLKIYVNVDRFEEME